MTRIQRRLLTLAIVLTVVGTIVWMVRRSPDRPATVWHCAATDELREAPTGPVFWGYEVYVTDNDPTGVRLHIRPQSSTVDDVRRTLGGMERQPLFRLRPTGAVVSEDGKSWEEHEVEWH